MGQLIENSRSVEGNNKRLNISVPHFDNSALIQGYAKTFVGRCMNPDEQDVEGFGGYFAENLEIGNPGHRGQIWVWEGFSSTLRKMKTLRPF